MAPTTLRCSRLAVIVPLAAALAGCRASQPTFSSEGNTRMPTAGVVGGTGEPSPAGRSNDDLLRNARLTELEPAKDEPTDGTWSKLLNPFRKPQAQPVSLPRTDLPREQVFDEPPPVHVIPDDF